MGGYDVRIGVTGHQKRDGISWPWVRHTFDCQFSDLENVEKALTCLAAGTDQVFAEVALGRGIPVVAVIPLDNYVRFFANERDAANYQRLVDRAEVLNLALAGEPEIAFLKAGEFIVDNCDLLFSLWDEEPGEGLGGTQDIVSYARTKSVPILNINPISRVVKLIHQ